MASRNLFDCVTLENCNAIYRIVYFKKKNFLICRAQRKMHEVPAVNNYVVVIMAV